MKCPKCSHDNEENALYCSNCGLNLVTPKQDWPNILLLAYAASLLVFGLFFFVFKLAADKMELDWHTTSYILAILNIVQSLTTILIPLGITKTKIKLAGFAIVALYIIFSVWNNVSWMSEVASMTN